MTTPNTQAATDAARRGARDWIALALLLCAAAAVYFWNLTASGYANEFYSAAAQAGSQSWSAFLWGALDAGGAITVDKPPASIWLMALSVRALGLSSFAILLPQALMGVACTFLVYETVRRTWGCAAGIIAGAIFVTTPVAALMFRFNNPDALLVLLMLGAAHLVTRAVQEPCTRNGSRRRTRLIAQAGLLVGLGFLTKQLQVLLVVPGFALALFACSPTSVRRRIIDGAVAIGSIVLGAGWWVLLTVLVPSGSRPYIGGSQTDSFLELTFGYNGLGRLTGDETGSVVAGGSAQGGMWGETGALRLFGSDFADQIAWLAPLAVLGIVVGAVLARRMHRAGDHDETGRARAAQLVIFGSWLCVTWVVFSYMAGIFHAYYTVALAPAVSVLAAICLIGLWRMRRSQSAQAIAVLACLACSIWSFVLIERSGSYGWLAICVLVAGIGAAGLGACAGIALVGEGDARRIRTGRAAGRVAIALGMAALAAGPVAWTACTIASGHSGSIVSAGPNGAMGGPGGGGAQGAAAGGDGAPAGGDDGTLAGGSGAPAGDDDGDAGPGGGMGGLLKGNSNGAVAELVAEGGTGYRWAAATTGSQNAAGYQLATGLPVMAIGGFNGTDPAPTLEQFIAYVESGCIRYYITGGQMSGKQMGGSSDAALIEAWVEENFTPVEIDGTTIYDLTEQP